MALSGPANGAGVRRPAAHAGPTAHQASPCGSRVGSDALNRWLATVITRLGIMAREVENENWIGWAASRVTTGLHDIEDRADCELLVRRFYSRALTDSLIGWIFTDVAKLDLESHVPRIASFWESVLLGAQSYPGGAFAPHAALHARAGLQSGHFARWLLLWNASVDELFRGDRAEQAKAHAARVAAAFQRRLNVLGPGQRATPPEGSLPISWHGPTAA
jgi:hemoglobin